MGVFFTLMSWSHESKSCMRVDKRGFLMRVFKSRALVKREQELDES